MSRKRDTRRRLEIEALEGRQLLAIIYDPVGDGLMLDGSAGVDNFSVSKVLVGTTEVIRVQEGAVVRMFPTTTKPIAHIAADLKDGPDVLMVASDVSIPLEANGGLGNDTIYGGAQTNNIRGGDDNDVIQGGVMKDTIYGGDGNDTILGLDGDDFLYGDDLGGMAGVDTIYGGPDKDTIYGYLGNDFLYGEGEDDTIYGGEDSDDLIEGADGNDTLYGEGGNDTILGEDGEDTILGGEENDTIYGGLMVDNLDGGQGIDRIHGDEGADILDGGSERDYLYGGADSDLLSGGSGNDQLFGDDPNLLFGFGQGDDILFGGENDDTLQGGGGADTLDGGEGVDTLFGDGGDDTLRGGTENDTLRGGTENDCLFGEEDDDLLFGDGGNDQIYAGSGTDSLEGGIGDDTLVSIDDDVADVLWGNSGLDSFWVDKDPGGLFVATTTDTVNDADSDEEDFSLHEVEEFENGADKSLDGDDIAEPAGGVRWDDFSNKPLFASAGPTVSDIRQGDAADCWMMSTLAAAAGASPNAIRQLVAPLGDGTFVVEFYDTLQLKKKHYRVDSELAVFDEQPDNIKYAGLGNEDSKWVAIVEEAFAMKRGNDYDSLNNDTPFFALGTIGGYGASFPIIGSWPLASHADVLKDVDEPGIGAVFCTDLDDADVSVLTSGHCYTIVDVTYDAVGEPTHVTLYNPYGKDDDNYYGDDDPDDGLVTITIGEFEHDAQSPSPIIYADFSQYNWA